MEPWPSVLVLGTLASLLLAGCTSGEPPPSPTPSGPAASEPAGTEGCSVSPEADAGRLLAPPLQSRPGVYQGPLYATSEKVGESAPWDLFSEDMRRNGVGLLVAYFFLQGEQKQSQLDPEEDLGYLLEAVRKDPDRIVPFFSTGHSGEEAKQLLGPELEQEIRTGYDSTVAVAGRDLIKGIGELEVHEWDAAPDDERVLTLYQFAESSGLHVMLHILPGQSEALGRALGRFPQTSFVVHMYPEDFDREKAALSDLFENHTNVHYTLNVDHMLFDAEAGTGLLYKFESLVPEEGARRFVAEFDAKSDSLQPAAWNRYADFILAHPDRVVWGTEMNPRYNYEPEVYDRIILFTREFLQGFPHEVRDRVAHSNAEGLFGTGVRCPDG